MRDELQNHTHAGRRRLALKREKQMVAQTLERAKTARERKTASQTEAGFELLQEWRGKVEGQIKEYLDRQSNITSNNKGYAYGPLQAIPTTISAAIALNCAIDAATDGWTLTKAREQIGKAFVCHLLEYICVGDSQREREFERFKRKVANMRGKDAYGRQDMFIERAKALKYNTEKWDDVNWQRNVGTILMSCVLSGVDFLFYEKFRKGDDRNETRYMVFSKNLVDLLKVKNAKLDLTSPYFSPMPVEPNDWFPTDDGWRASGCYNDRSLNMRLEVVRHMGKAQRQEVQDMIESGKLDRPLDALHTIQQVPYEINLYVLLAVNHVRRLNKGADVNNWLNQVEIPPLKKVEKAEWEAMGDKGRQRWLKRRDKVRAANVAARSNTVNISRYINEAKQQYKDGWFCMPHNWDSRSRTYHVSDFGHHNADYIRGMFNFHNKQEITKENVAHLHIAIVSAYGEADKEELEEQLAWFDKNEDWILDCGRAFWKPEAFEKWSQADEPFQFLGLAREYYLAVKAWGEGRNHLSGVPIAKDAAQSGVQHFALSLLDEEDAKRVNLSNGPRRDLYLDCLAEAKRLMHEDLAVKRMQYANDPPTEKDRKAERQKDELLLSKDLSREEKKAIRRRWNRTAARRRLKIEREIEIIPQVLAWEKAKILPYGRSVIKRNCMTYCYSSRRFGFSQQLRSDWMDKLSEKVRLNKLNQHPFGDDEGFDACTYLGGLHERAIENVINSAEKGMDFIQKIVRILATYEMELGEEELNNDTSVEEEENKIHNPKGIHLRFLTPDGFPMYQNYRKENTATQQVSFFDKGFPIGPEYEKDGMKFRYYTDELWVNKSINACAPNLIHAMDATHLREAVLRCKEMGFTDLMVVHDSFATTIGNVGKLQVALRQTLVELYKDYNLYEDLLKQAKALHPNPDSVDWPEPPKRGAFDIEQVLQSQHSFSQSASA